jgi:Fe-S-cluster containining protein
MMMHDKSVNPESIIRDVPRLTRDDRFLFHCDKSLECFTCCCRDVTIVLTPYDVLRMKQALHLDSSEFLEKYTLSPFSKDQKIPAVILKMDAETKRCPFVTEQGCSIYANRPWACRMYPLGMAEPDKPTPTEQAFHFLIREDLCKGHDIGQSLTVSDWISAQGIEEYDAWGAPFKELMLHPFWNREEFLTPEQIEMFYMACYDIDRFRRFVFQTHFLELFYIDEDRAEVMRRDDFELSDFAMQWLKFCLFHEESLKIKHAAKEAARTRMSHTGQKIHG